MLGMLEQLALEHPELMLVSKQAAVGIFTPRKLVDITDQGLGFCFFFVCFCL